MASALVARAARTLARAPIGLYDAGYGCLLGHRCLMLEHTGRISGRPRFVVLEVVRRTDGGRYAVASGRGTAADWYRNVIKEPQVRVSVGRLRRVPAVARPLDHDEGRAVLEAYRTERPGTWRLLKPFITRVLGRPGKTDEALFASVPLVELTLDHGGRGRGAG
jgi:deazaflavin-dependent oxidoreductase (nitroreductase family)